ncbi:hypothetical protein BC826DRAFT_1082182, partial [Russula brevipes]
MATVLGESLSITLRRLAACRRRYPFPPPLNPPSSWSSPPQPRNHAAQSPFLSTPVVDPPVRRSQLSALISPSAAAQHPTVQPIAVSQQPTAPAQTVPNSSTHKAPRAAPESRPCD